MKKGKFKNISKNKKVGIISSLLLIFITTIFAFDFMGVKSEYKQNINYIMY